MVTTDEMKREVIRELERRGISVNHELTNVRRDDGGNVHVDVHLRGPLWWTALRWLLLYPLTIPYRVVAALEDQPSWHALRGHRVEHRAIMGEASGPLRMWDHYCHTCEVAW